MPEFVEKKVETFLKVSAKHAVRHEVSDSSFFRSHRAAVLGKESTGVTLASPRTELESVAINESPAREDEKKLKITNHDPGNYRADFFASVCWDFGRPLAFPPAPSPRGVCLAVDLSPSSDLPRGKLAVAQTHPGYPCQQELYTAENKTDLSQCKFLGRERGQLKGEALCVYDNTAAYLRFLREVFGVDGLDGKGTVVRSTIHYGQNYGNAFFDGEQMVYGEGDGRIFKGFSCDFSVVAHELSHGFSGNLLFLEYKGQSGALNESLSDVFACAARHWREKTPCHKGVWVIGDRIMDHPHCLRSLSSPGSAYRDHPVIGNDPQVAHMKNLYVGEKDEGGVHVNSGIPNRAFYLFSNSVGGNCWETPAQIWFKVLREKMVSRYATFEDFARATLKAAAGESPAVRQKLRDAWQEVGVAC